MMQGKVKNANMSKMPYYFLKKDFRFGKQGQRMFAGREVILMQKKMFVKINTTLRSEL